MLRIEVYDKFLDDTYKMIASGQSYRSLAKLLESIMFSFEIRGYKEVESVADDAEYFTRCKNFIKSNLRNAGLIDYITTAWILNEHSMQTEVMYDNTCIKRLKDMAPNSEIMNACLDVIQYFDDEKYYKSLKSLNELIKQVLLFAIREKDKLYQSPSGLEELITQAGARNIINNYQENVLKAYSNDLGSIFDCATGKLNRTLEPRFMETDCYIGLIAEVLLKALNS